MRDQNSHIPFSAEHSPDTRKTGVHFEAQSSEEREAHSYLEHNLQRMYMYRHNIVIIMYMYIHVLMMTVWLGWSLQLPHQSHKGKKKNKLGVMAQYPAGKTLRIILNPVPYTLIDLHIYMYTYMNL